MNNDSYWQPSKLGKNTKWTKRIILTPHQLGQKHKINKLNKMIHIETPLDLGKNTNELNKQNESFFKSFKKNFFLVK